MTSADRSTTLCQHLSSQISTSSK